MEKMLHKFSEHYSFQICIKWCYKSNKSNKGLDQPLFFFIFYYSPVIWDLWDGLVRCPREKRSCWTKGLLLNLSFQLLYKMKTAWQQPSSWFKVTTLLNKTWYSQAHQAFVHSFHLLVWCEWISCCLLLAFRDVPINKEVDKLSGCCCCCSLSPP